MSVVISDQSPKSPLALHLLNQHIQQEVLSFCGAADPFLYARVNRAAAAFSNQNAVRSLYFSLKNTNYLDWERVEKDVAVLAHITDQQIQNLGAEKTQNFTNFLHQLREIVALDESDEKKARLFSLFLSFCPEVTQLDLTTRRIGEKHGDMEKFPSLAVVSSILETPDIHSRIKALRLNGYDKAWNLIPVFSSHIIHFDSLESLECHLSAKDLDALASTPSFQKNLKSLAIERAQLPSLAPLGKLTSLQSLDLHGSIIADFDDDHPEIPSMPQLRVLELGAASHFEDSIIQAICKALPRLERLKIEEAQHITDLGIQSISQLKFLKELYLSPCSRITDKAFEHLASSPHLRKNLRSLSVCHYKTAGNEGLTHVAKLTNLSELDLMSSTFTEDHFAPLVALQKLQKLKCSFMKATDRMLAYIGEIRSLRHLEFYNGLNGEAVTDLGIESLQNLKDLRFLTLHRCDRITNEGYRHLSNLTRLEQVWIESRHPISTTTLQNLGNLRRLKQLYLYGGSLEAPKEAVLAFLTSRPELDYTRVGLGNKYPRAIQQLIQEG